MCIYFYVKRNVYPSGFINCTFNWKGEWSENIKNEILSVLELYMRLDAVFMIYFLL